MSVAEWEGSGTAQHAMLSEGSDPANPPDETFELNLFKKRKRFTDLDMLLFLLVCN